MYTCSCNLLIFLVCLELTPYTHTPPLEIEGDNLSVIQELKGNFQIPWQISNIVEDVRASLGQDTRYVIHHLYQEANMVVDWLSKFSHSITDFFSMELCFFSLFFG